MTRGSILLVEDNPDDLALTMRALKKNNIANPIVVASDGAEALQMLHGPDAAAFVCLQRFREFYAPELVCSSGVRAILYA